MECVEHCRYCAERCDNRQCRSECKQPREQRRELHSSSSAEYRKFVCNDGSRGGSGYGNGLEFRELAGRSEERRVGNESRCRGSGWQEKKRDEDGRVGEWTEAGKAKSSVEDRARL